MSKLKLALSGTQGEEICYHHDSRKVTGQVQNTGLLSMIPTLVQSLDTLLQVSRGQHRTEGKYSFPPPTGMANTKDGYVTQNYS